MGTECIGARLDESDIIPPVPPGFGPLTAFTLQRIQENAPRVQENALASPCTSSSLQTPMDVEESTSEEGRLKKSLRHRPWVNYSQFDNSSDEEYSEPELVKPETPAIKHLSKGVIRGCLECANCQKVNAQWRPQDACRPVLDEAPIFYPTEEEFKDTLKYIASIRPMAEPYGICRIVPPPSWRPPCPLKEKDVWENSKFATRIQKVHKLQNRDSVKKICRNLSLMKRKRRKILKTETECKEVDSTVETNAPGYHNNTERFGFEPGPDFTLESFEKYANDFKEQYFRTKDNEGLLSGQPEPLPENIEGEYWRIIERPTEEIEVLYGADLETGVFGSGFPKASLVERGSDSEDPYVKSGWNLNNFPRLPGSVLAFESGDISGVLVPWLYIGMCFSSFCWHVEDHHLYSLNYLHWGAPKMWYGVPGRDALKLEAAMKKHLADLFEEQPDLLHNLVTQFSPSSLKREGVPVNRCLQRAGEFVLTFPRAYHSGFNCGFNCAEAVNVAPVDWLPHGQNAVELYREQVRKISISHDKLLLGAAREAVRAQWNISFLGKNTIDNLRWKDACGIERVLAKSFKDRVEMERVRREIIGSSKSRKMDAGFDANCERECVICHYDLHLSAVGCTCSPDRFACLTHAKELCSCDWSGRFFLFRYEISELNILMDALGGKLSAVHRWGLSDLGLSLSSVVTREKAPESKLSWEKTPEFKPSREKTLESKPSREQTPEPKLPREKTPESKTSPNRLTSVEVTFQKDKGPPCHSNFGGAPRINSSHQAIKLSVLQQTSFKGQAEGQNFVVDSKEPYPGSFLPKLRDCHNLKPDCHNLKPQEGYTSSQIKEMVSPQSFPEARDLGNSKNNVPDRMKNHKDVMVLDVDGHKRRQALPSDKVKEEPPRENLETLARLKSIDKVTTCNSQNERVLVTPETNASIISESDKNLQRALEETSSILNKVSHCGNSTCGPIGNPVSKFLDVKQGVGCSVTNAQSQLKHVEVLASANTNDVYRDWKISTGSTHNLIEGDSVAVSPSCPPSLDRHNRMQKGPRMAKVVRRINCNVEPLEYGVVLAGKLWSTSQAIFPKGYRSRVRYFSVLDPTQMCYYVSEILDAGLLGPLFMVKVEKCPSEVFIHVSATKCWDMVRERVNNEIRKHQNSGKVNVPTPQPPGSLDGLEMFGLTSPTIIQAIEAIDPHHHCTEYWRSRPQSLIAVGSTISSGNHQLGGAEQGAFSGANAIVRGLLKKGNPEELQALHRLLSSNDPMCKKELISLLDEEI